jgi:hypothetical protein
LFSTATRKKRMRLKNPTADNRILSNSIQGRKEL